MHEPVCEKLPYKLYPWEQREYHDKCVSMPINWNDELARVLLEIEGGDKKLVEWRWGEDILYPIRYRIGSLIIVVRSEEIITWKRRRIKTRVVIVDKERKQVIVKWFYDTDHKEILEYIKRHYS